MSDFLPDPNADKHKSGLISHAVRFFSGGRRNSMKITHHALTIEDDFHLAYQRGGAGQPIIFIPGWTMTSGFFKGQVEHFSKTNDVIAMDPRSHGASAQTADGNNYTQHGKDLKALIDGLGLKDVVLVGWSFGVLDIYSYIEQFGDDNVKSLVLIDQGPASLPDSDYNWAIGAPAGLLEFAEALRHNRQEFIEGFLASCFENQPDQSDLAWMLSQSLKTPENTALELIFDGWLRDYRNVLENLTTPTLQIVRRSWEQDAKSYLHSAAPQSEVFVQGEHLMFWEFKDAINQKITDFLSRV